MFIQTEATPNPATLKFLPGRPVLEAGTLDMPTREAAAQSPLAGKLFDLPNVGGVFYGADFISVTKTGGDWQQIKPAVLGAIMEHYMSGAPLVAAEAQAAVSNAEAGLYLIGFREGAKLRRERLEAGLRELDAEELGARDALTEAFEALKKYENVVETARVVARKEEGRRETAMLDELGLRKRA